MPWPYVGDLTAYAGVWLRATEMEISSTLRTSHYFIFTFTAGLDGSPSVISYLSHLFWK